MFLFYNFPFLQMCNLQENIFFSTLTLDSVFSDYVIFFGDISFILLSAIQVQILLNLPACVLRVII